MQTVNPQEHGYVSGNGLLIHNQSSHTPDWKAYLQNMNYIPPLDEHKTFVYSSNQITEIFSLRSKLNLFSFYSVSGKYEVNMISCLTELVDTLSKIFVSNIPHQKVLNMVGYKLLVYLPDTIQPPFGFIKDETYTHDFLGGVLPKESMRLYIRSFQYNDHLGLHALPCNDFEYSIMSSFYKFNITPQGITTPNTMTYNSGTFGTYTAPSGLGATTNPVVNTGFGTAPAPSGFGATTNPVVNTGFGTAPATNTFNIFSKK